MKKKSKAKTTPRKATAVWKVAVGFSESNTWSRYHYLTNSPSEAALKALAQAKRECAADGVKVTSVTMVCELD